MTNKQWAKLWFNAMIYAIKIWNLAPARCDCTKTRYEIWHNKKSNVKEAVLLPFGTLVVTRRGVVGLFGRGSPGIYIGPSPTVPGGILVYNPHKSSVITSGSFVLKPYDYSPGAIIAKHYGMMELVMTLDQR